MRVPAVRCAYAKTVRGYGIIDVEGGKLLFAAPGTNFRSA